jgi:hypothetical protein
MRWIGNSPSSRGWRVAWSFLFLLLGVVVMCCPRFNDENAGDTRYYVEVVSFIRGGFGPSTVSSPYAYRLAGPLLASLLPLEPLTALNVVNVMALGIAAILLHQALRVLGGSASVALAGSALFVFSFPTLWYGPIGYVDPVLILCLTVFVFALCIESDGLAAVAFLLGCLAKEWMLLAVPAYFGYALLRPSAERARAVTQSVLVVCAGATVLVAMRLLIPVVANFSIWPSVAFMMANASRPRAWLTLFLGFGVPGTLLTVLLCQRTARARLFRHRVGTPLALGALGSIGWVGLTWFAGYLDGRCVWTLYPFAVPMIGLMWPGGRPTSLNFLRRAA